MPASLSEKLSKQSKVSLKNWNIRSYLFGCKIHLLKSYFDLKNKSFVVHKTSQSIQKLFCIHNKKGEQQNYYQIWPIKTTLIRPLHQENVYTWYPLCGFKPIVEQGWDSSSSTITFFPSSRVINWKKCLG
jgi:hypothetical protein